MEIIVTQQRRAYLKIKAFEVLRGTREKFDGRYAGLLDFHEQKNEARTEKVFKISVEDPSPNIYYIFFNLSLSWTQ